MRNAGFPAGKYMAIVKVGAKGQIVIPAEARDLLHIQPGDSLLLLADEERGLALPPHAQSQKIMEQLMSQMNGGVFNERD